MNNKFIRCISPVSLIIILIADFSVLFLGYYSYKSYIEKPDFYSICFIIIIIFAVILLLLLNIQLLKTGISFKETNFIYNGKDFENEFSYSQIADVSYEKDNKVSFTKNFDDRHTILILNNIDNTETSIDIGITTKYKAEKIILEIKKRADLN